MLLEQWLNHIESVHFRSVDLQLDRVDAVLRRLLPQGPRYKVLTVAGTNGKGSSVEMLNSILTQTGRCVGAYTSPHLVSYTERVRVDGRTVSPAELCSAFKRVEHCREEIPLTYFEFGTLAALLVFEDRGVQVAVLEVGMGGRLDAVNAVESSAALITSVAMDHQHWLGSTREAIGREKAGVFRRGRPAVCADPDPPAVIAAYAGEIGAELYQIGRHFTYNSDGDRWHWTGSDRELVNLPRPAMVGEFQLQNAAGAIMLLLALQAEIAVSEEHIRRGLSTAKVRGRFEVIGESPRIVMDVAHNEAAILEVMANLEAMDVHGGVLVVCGMLRDKPIDVVGSRLGRVAAAWYLGEIADPRGCPAAELAQAIRLYTQNPIGTYESVVEAFQAARGNAGPDDVVLVLGSFHTVGDIIRALETGRVAH